MVPLRLQADFWGLLAGSALLLVAAIGYYAKIPQQLIAAIMAFGSSVLTSALAFELMDEAYKRGGFDSTAISFINGAAIYTLANWYFAHQRARHRKRSGNRQPSESENSGSGLAIAMGALLDGIPESIAIAIRMNEGGTVSWVTLAAVFLSNFPEGLPSATGMKQSGRSLRYIFGIWGLIAVVSGAVALSGYALFSHFSTEVVAATIAIAVGAILALISDMMMPEAFEQADDFIG